MQTQTYYGRPDGAFGETGVITFDGETRQRSVTLEFRGNTINFRPHKGLPAAGQTLTVDGVERHFWVEYIALLRRRRDLRDVAGHDLRFQEVAVITTDDGRRYAFLTDPDLPRAVIEAIPEGRRRAIPLDALAQEAA